MNIVKFKTNINCNGCLSKVSPQLNATQGIENWQVDLNNPDKILTVNANTASEVEIVNAVKKAGFNITKI